MVSLQFTKRGRKGEDLGDLRKATNEIIHFLFAVELADGVQRILPLLRGKGIEHVHGLLVLQHGPLQLEGQLIKIIIFHLDHLAIRVCKRRKDDEWKDQEKNCFYIIT